MRWVARTLSVVNTRSRCKTALQRRKANGRNGNKNVDLSCQLLGISKVGANCLFAQTVHSNSSLNFYEIVVATATDTDTDTATKIPWNKRKIIGQKAPLKLMDIWAIQIRLQLGHSIWEFALFDLGLNIKLRACDLVRLHVRDICHDDRISTRAIFIQQKTSKPVQFKITTSTIEVVAEWIKQAHLSIED